jgi:hypothetical protein
VLDVDLARADAMPGNMRNLLTPKKALIFRIIHRDNLRWILENGLHCRNSNRIDPNFVIIGNPDLITSRNYRMVPVPPGGTLSDYVPFYFTPLSVMLLNIKTGYRGVQQRRNDEIIILVSSLHKLQSDKIKFLFTDRHAYLGAAQYFSEAADLNQLDWEILQNRDFKRDNENPEKMERYQAEILVHRGLPISSLLGAVCYNATQRDTAKTLIGAANVCLSVYSQPGWYF